MPDKSSVLPVRFHFLKQSAQLKDRKRLKGFIASIFTKEKTHVSSLTYIFCSDQYLLGINRQFLQHDYYTDIISFNMAAKNAALEGEIYISLDRVKENARIHGQAFETELHRVIFHGVLHFCGYKDKMGKDIAIMRKKENHYLKAYFA